VLAEMYGGFVTGDHLEMETVSGEPQVTNVAGLVSHQRTLHWKSADDWLAYNREFGRYTPTDAWLNSVTKSADHYALMKVFGCRPKENFDEIIAYAKNRAMGQLERIAIDKRENALRNRFAVVSGEADRPIANVWSGVVDGVMAVQRLSKLSFTPFAMLQDNVTISRELSRHGLDFLERNMSLLSAISRARREARSARSPSCCTLVSSAGCVPGANGAYDEGQAGDRVLVATDAGEPLR
jgi:hypothetical protein